jgi:hypothetical protein
MKDLSTGQQFAGSAHLLDGIQAVLDEMQRSELEHVFHHRIKRVQCVLDKDGHDFHE